MKDLSSSGEYRRLRAVWRCATVVRSEGPERLASEHVLDELHRLVGPVLESPAVQRLAGVTFLGILSPAYAAVRDGGRRADRGGFFSEAGKDGTRLDHSIGVAHLNVELARGFGFSVEAQRYAAAWGLLHDLGNWPLSHTAEGAFRLLTGRSARAAERAHRRSGSCGPTPDLLDGEAPSRGRDRP